MNSQWDQHPVLGGEHVRLEPLTLEHVEDLHAAGRDPGIRDRLVAKLRMINAKT